MNRFAVTMMLSIALFSRAAIAGVDLSQSTFSTDMGTVPAGAIVTVNVVLRNSGDAVSERTDVRIRFPQNGFLVRIDELPDLKRDDNEREVTAVVSIPAKGEYRFSYDLLASRKEAQHTLSSDIEVRNFLADARLDTEFSIRITNAPSTAGVVVGRVRGHPAAFWLLGWMVFGGLLYLRVQFRLRWIREHPRSSVLPSETRRIPAFGIVVLTMIPLAFLMVAGGLAWRDLQTLTNWKESEATILDRREVIRTTTRNEPGQRRRTSSTRTPEFALRYQVGEREVISSGFDTGMSLHFGGQVASRAAMDDWVAGKTVPCWYDPADPANVVVRRGFGGGYFFFLIPVPILWFGLMQLRVVGKAIRQLNDLESAVF